MMVHIWLQRQTWQLDTWEETDCSICKKNIKEGSQKAFLAALALAAL